MLYNNKMNEHYNNESIINNHLNVKVLFINFELKKK